MFNRFYPDEWVGSSYSIDYEVLYEKGYRGILFDIDNTLVPHGEPADEKAINLFKKLKSLGFKCCLISNNKEERVAIFNKDIKADFIFKARKPLSESYLKAMKKLGTNKRNTVFIGDQLFTDVYGAKRIGIYNILVKPINPKEEIQIVLKRYLERIVLHYYAKAKES